jgi:serine/threonine protein kinase
MIVGPVESEHTEETRAAENGSHAHGRRADLSRGATVDRHIIVERLAWGGMGLVRKAFDPELSRPVAVELLQADAGPGSVSLDRLLREAQALARLSHPNVIAVHDVGTFLDDVFIAMGFVEGESLRRRLEEPRSQREILNGFLAAGEGLAAAPRASFLHRDFEHALRINRFLEHEWRPLLDEAARLAATP